MRFCVILLFSLLFGCVATKLPITFPRKTTPKYALDPAPKRILLLHTYDVDSKKYRKNKEELFKQFLDSILVTCETEINKRESIPSTVIRGYTHITTTREDSIYALMNMHQATHAIVIDSFDVGFTQTRVEVEKSADGGKSREAFYDIRSGIHFLLYSGHSLYKELQMTKSIPYTSRSVVSGLLAAGPNVVTKKKDAWALTRSNVDDYLNLFFKNNF